MLRMEIALFLVMAFVAAIYYSAGRRHTPLHRTFAVLLGTVLVVGMVIALMLCYVKLTGISDNVSSIKREISALEEEHVALLTAYERTFDLATVKAAAEAAGMSKPSSGQIQYIDLSGADSVEVYAAGGAAALNGFTEKAESLWAYVLEYFR